MNASTTAPTTASTIPATPTATPTTLADLTTRTGLDVLDHLEREVAIPVLDGLQAQGDLIVIPAGLLEDANAREPRHARWQEVPPHGIELLRSAGGGNPHSLVADPGTCRWTAAFRDPVGLALGLVETTGVAYLIHPEHGASGLAPGRYIVRRQRERGVGGPGRSLGFGRRAFFGNRMVCD